MVAKAQEILIPRGVHVWPHELSTARALASSGHRIEFIPPVDGNRIKSPDILMDGVAWEMKSPDTKEIRRLERILRRASKQSKNVIIDTARMTRSSDEAIERELRRLAPFNKDLHRLVLVTKKRRVIDIRTK